MDLVETIAELDSQPNLHAARLLVLISAFSDVQQQEALEGLTKLAKLDFLLRYPVMLERALSAKGRSTRDVQLKDYERLSVESQMVRYRFGPWDHRYREFLNILIGKGLVTVRTEGRKIVIALTENGRELALKLSANPEFQDYARRSELLKRHFNLKGTSLMNFIYETFPEVVSLRSNERIPT
ncbi:ABC-three component system middle component 4 [Imhoffiella purpurea]|uniref:ABC-three component system middle component 4 n=1 Tax=Imhoffiella purpurea TaxID=1249627 RepID=UPI0005C21B8E|nr:ABC-three component system middle component 4 [Imhoffiella purpurea]